MYKRQADNLKLSPLDLQGLGFGMKWNMGWMHDTLGYFKRDPVYRKHHHDSLTLTLPPLGVLLFKPE